MGCIYCSLNEFNRGEFGAGLLDVGIDARHSSRSFDRLENWHLWATALCPPQ